MQGSGEEYDNAIAAVWEQVKKLSDIATPPGKLSLASKVEEAENACEEAIKYINGDIYHRSDVATEKLLNEKIKHMEEVRS